MEKNPNKKFPFFVNKEEEAQELELAEVLTKKVETIEEVPEYVLKNKTKYHFHTEILYGKAVVTPDRQKAEQHPNFQDVSLLQTVESQTEYLYGPWSEPIEGIAPKELIEKRAAKQIAEKIAVFANELTIPENAVKVRKKVDDPSGDVRYDIHVSSLEVLREEEKAVARRHHVETPVALGRTEDIRKHFPSERTIPEIAVKGKNTHMIALNRPHEKKCMTSTLSKITDEEAREYAKRNAIANKEKHRKDKPKKTDDPKELETSEIREFTPMGKGAQDYHQIARTQEELHRKLLERGRTPEEAQEILKVAMPKLFFVPSDKTNGDKAVVMWEDEDISQKLRERKYNDQAIEQIQNVIKIIHEEVIYNSVEARGERFSGGAKNVIELASKLKEFARMDEKQITQVIRHAKKISENPPVYAWSQRKQLTYAWHESDGFAWGSRQLATYSWYEALYPYGLEYEYMWSVSHDYSYTYRYDYEIHTPRYIQRTVEPVTYEERHEMYAYRYDKLLYCWEEIREG